VSHQVRFDIFGGTCEQRTGAAKAGDDFVGNEQDVELAARIAHRLEPALRRHDHAARALHRLAEECGYAFGAKRFDLRTQCGDRRVDHRLRIVAHLAAIQIRRRNVMLVRQRHIEVLMKRAQCGQARAHRRRTVIAALQRNELLLLRAARRVVVVRDVADCGIHRIRAAQREVHVTQRVRRQFDELFGEPDGRFAAEVEIAGRIGQAAHLLGRYPYDAFVTVAGIHAPEAREGIEQFVAVDIAQPGAAPRLENRDAALLMRAQAGYRMDQMFAVGFDQ
jgi:hypothetical protein